MDYVFIKSKKVGKEEYGAVYARVRTKEVNKKYSLGFTIRESEWMRYRSLNYASSAMMTSIGIRYGQFAAVLAQVKAAFESDFDADRATTIIRAIKAQVLNGGEIQVKGSAKGKKSMVLTEYIDKYIEDLKSGARMKKGKAVKVSMGYIHCLVVLCNSIKRYELERRKTVTLDDVTMEFQRDYLKWCTEHGKSPNTMAGAMSRLHTVMLSAYEDKLTMCDDFRRSDFVPGGEEVDHIFLTPQQIQYMLDFDLSTKDVLRGYISNSRMKKKEKEALIEKLENGDEDGFRKELEAVRDVFVVGCLTGQRISDYSRISKEMIVEIESTPFIQLVQVKTGKKILIPMDKRVKKILDKYDGTLPQVHQTDFNQNLRLIGEWMGWTAKAKIDERRITGKKSCRFCDMLGSHTARRSFATNAYAAGVPLGSIMAITGHSTEKNLRRYLKLQAEDKAIIAAKDFEGIIKMA